MFVESVFLNHLINFQTSPFPKRLVITHTKTIYLCQNLRNIHIGVFKKIYIPIKCFKTQQTKGNIYDIL